MLRNWVTQFGLDAGDKAGNEKVSDADRNKFIGQVGTYLGWNPPVQMNWSVEIIKEDADNYIAVFARYLTADEIERLLRTNYNKPKSEQLGVNYMKEKLEAFRPVNESAGCGPTCGCKTADSASTPDSTPPATNDTIDFL